MGNRIGHSNGIPNESDSDDDALLDQLGYGRSKFWDFITCKWNMSNRKQTYVLVSLSVLVAIAMIVPIVLTHHSFPNPGNTTTSAPSPTTSMPSTFTTEPTQTTLSTEITEEPRTEQSTTSTEIPTERTTTAGKHECRFDDTSASAFTCPDGENWGCWMKQSTRDKQCKEKGWNQCWRKMVRRWKYDCYCCSLNVWSYE